MTSPDLYLNHIQNVLVIGPAPQGRLGRIAEERTVALHRGGPTSTALSRWIFADLPRQTLRDEWGNPYDHQVHTLLAGTLQQGLDFINDLKAAGFLIEQADEFFVPFQTLDPNDRDSSDQLRERFPRAFAIARRERPALRELITILRDSALLG